MKKNTVKKLLSALLTVILLLSAVPFGGFAECGLFAAKAYASFYDGLVSSGNLGDYLYYYIYDDDYYLVVSGTGNMPDYTIGTSPFYEIRDYIWYINVERGVENIGNYVFYECDSMYTVELCDYVERIGAYSFGNCDKLSTVWMSTSVTDIQEGAFSGCKNLTNITLPDTLTSIGPRAFYYCKRLDSIRIPENVTSIEAETFYKCESLKSVTIPASVTSIDESAFDNTALTDVYFFGTTTQWNNIICDLRSSPLTNANVYFCVTDGSFDYRVINGEAVVVGYIGSSGGKVEIPEEVNGYPVTAIAQNAFNNGITLSAIVIPTSVKRIENDAFGMKCSISKVYYTGTREQWNQVSVDYENNYNLKNKTVNCNAGSTCLHYDIKNNEVIISGCESSAQGEIIIPKTIENYPVTKIGARAFQFRNEITSIIIPDSVKSIEEYAFSGCTGLTSITISDSVTNINRYAFDNCTSLESVYYEGTIEEWCNISFNNDFSNPMCQAENLYINNELITNLNIPETINEIKAYTFFKCTGLTSVIIPDSITSIGEGAFSGCTGLTSVTIPESVTVIGKSLFKGCTGLTSVMIPDSVTSLGESVFSDCTGLTSVTIPESVTSIGRYAFSNCTSLTSITIPESVTSIGRYAFSYCTSLTSITIPDSITSLGDDVFRDCTGLTSVTIPESVTSLGGDVFSGCTGLTSITIPESVTSIGWGAFSYCTSLTSITIPDGVTRISSETFLGCTGLTSITIPDKVTVIDSSAFSGCASLTSITLPDNVTSIGESAFSSCTGLTSITIPDSVTRIESDAFWDCSGLTYVRIPKSVTNIDGSVFGRCTGLTSITIPNSVTYIVESAFYNCTGLTDVYYNGTESEWGKIYIEYDNSYLTNATIHYVTFSASENSSAVVDNNNKLVYGLGVGLSSVEGLFNTTDDSIEVATSSSGNRLGTGAKISLNVNGNTIEEYTVVIFGDSNGDGYYDGMDALTVSCIANGMLTKDDVGEAVWFASDCNHDGTIDEFDVEILNYAGLLLNEVDQTLSTNELVATSAYQEYIQLIDQSPDMEETEDPVPTEPTPEQPNQSIFIKIISFIFEIFKWIFKLFK